MQTLAWKGDLIILFPPKVILGSLSREDDTGRGGPRRRRTCMVLLSDSYPEPNLSLLRPYFPHKGPWQSHPKPKLSCAGQKMKESKAEPGTLSGGSRKDWKIANSTWVAFGRKIKNLLYRLEG